MRGRLARVLAFAALAASAVWSADAQMAAPEPPDRFAPVRFLLGSWRGTASGEPGKGTVEREYALTLGGSFIHERNETTYPAQAANPGGEVHEHQSFFSYDGARSLVVLRQFHQEGFVNTYVHDPRASGPSKLVFVSEAFENIGAAWKARESYTLISADEFVETFEIAPPGKPFATYSESRLKRIAR